MPDVVELPNPSQLRYMRYMEGRSYAEIATLYGTTVERVYRLVHEGEVIDLITDEEDGGT